MQERFRTPAIPETYSPEWNQTIVLPIPRLSQVQSKACGLHTREFDDS